MKITKNGIIIESKTELKKVWAISLIVILFIGIMAGKYL